jgi:hypothetical protein
VTTAQHHRFGNGTGNAAHLVPGIDEDFFDHIGDHQVVLSN